MTAHLALAVVVLICAYSDLSRGKVYNRITYPAIAIGFALGFWSGGLAGLLSRLIGFSVAFGPLWLAFLIGGMGGGDVKLAGAIGALAGFPFVLYALLYSALIGGAMALALLIWRGELARAFHRWRPVPAGEVAPLITRSIHYGFALAAGTLWAQAASLWPSLQAF